MKLVKYILETAEAMGYTAEYGNPSQVNERMTYTDYSAIQDGVLVYCFLITSSDVYEGRERADIGIYFASLCDFDFAPRDLITEQERLKEIAFSLYDEMGRGNVITMGEPRFTYGYDDFAENVAWVCMRLTVEELAERCVERTEPEPPTPPTPPSITDPMCPVICVADGFSYNHPSLVGLPSIQGLFANDIYFHYAVPQGGEKLKIADFTFENATINTLEKHDCGTCDDALANETNATAIEWLQQHSGDELWMFKAVLSGHDADVTITDPNSGVAGEYNIYWPII